MVLSSVRILKLSYLHSSDALPHSVFLGWQCHSNVEPGIMVWRSPLVSGEFFLALIFTWVERATNVPKKKGKGKKGLSTRLSTPSGRWRLQAGSSIPWIQRQNGKVSGHNQNRVFNSRLRHDLRMAHVFHFLGTLSHFSNFNFQPPKFPKPDSKPV